MSCEDPTSSKASEDQHWVRLGLSASVGPLTLRPNGEFSIGDYLGFSSITSDIKTLQSGSVCAHTEDGTVVALDQDNAYRVKFEDGEWHELRKITDAHLLLAATVPPIDEEADVVGPITLHSDGTFQIAGSTERLRYSPTDDIIQFGAVRLQYEEEYLVVAVAGVIVARLSHADGEWYSPWPTASWPQSPLPVSTPSSSIANSAKYLRSRFRAPSALIWAGCFILTLWSIHALCVFGPLRALFPDLIAASSSDGSPSFFVVPALLRAASESASVRPYWLTGFCYTAAFFLLPAAFATAIGRSRKIRSVSPVLPFAALAAWLTLFHLLFTEELSAWASRQVFQIKVFKAEVAAWNDGAQVVAEALAAVPQEHRADITKLFTDQTLAAARKRLPAGLFAMTIEHIGVHGTVLLAMLVAGLAGYRAAVSTLSDFRPAPAFAVLRSELKARLGRSIAPEGASMPRSRFLAFGAKPHTWKDYVPFLWCIPPFAVFVPSLFSGSGFAPPLPRESLLPIGLAAASLVGFLAIVRFSFPPFRPRWWELYWRALVVGTVGLGGLLLFQHLLPTLRGQYIVSGGNLVSMLAFCLLKMIDWAYQNIDASGSSFTVFAFAYVVSVGLCEEVCKASFIRCQDDSSWQSWATRGLACGVGFGVAEGLWYSMTHYHGVEPWYVYAARFTYGPGMHAVWAASSGLILARFDGEGMLIAVAPQALLHGLYDALLTPVGLAWASVVDGFSLLWLLFLVWVARTDRQY